MVLDLLEPFFCLKRRIISALKATAHERRAYEKNPW
jgi:uncharacterized DUF497 family protein